MSLDWNDPDPFNRAYFDALNRMYMRCYLLMGSSPSAQNFITSPAFVPQAISPGGAQTGFYVVDDSTGEIVYTPKNSMASQGVLASSFSSLSRIQASYMETLYSGSPRHKLSSYDYQTLAIAVASLLQPDSATYMMGTSATASVEKKAAIWGFVNTTEAIEDARHIPTLSSILEGQPLRGAINLSSDAPYNWPAMEVVRTCVSPDVVSTSYLSATMVRFGDVIRWSAPSSGTRLGVWELKELIKTLYKLLSAMSSVYFLGTLSCIWRLHGEGVSNDGSSWSSNGPWQALSDGLYAANSSIWWPNYAASAQSWLTSDGYTSQAGPYVKQICYNAFNPTPFDITIDCYVKVSGGSYTDNPFVETDTPLVNNYRYDFFSGASLGVFKKISGLSKTLAPYNRALVTMDVNSWFSVPLPSGTTEDGYRNEGMSYAPNYIAFVVAPDFTSSNWPLPD